MSLLARCRYPGTDPTDVRLPLGKESSLGDLSGCSCTFNRYVELNIQILIMKKSQMFELARKLGAEGEHDPSLLHPLFSRLPPLDPDTPSETMPSKADLAELGDQADMNDPNPYNPMPLSEVFALADDLMLKYPWDGPIIRGKEIMGPGSVVSSYELEASAIENGLSPQQVMEMIDRDVVWPGAGMADDDEEDVAAAIRPRLLVPKNRLRTTVSLGVVVLGLGIVLYSWRVEDRRGGGYRWWSLVFQNMLSKRFQTQDLSRLYRSAVGYGM